MKLSAVVLTKNEEKNIKRCLKSLRFCDEIIIIDDYSQDKTIEEVYRVGKFIKLESLKVYKRHLEEDFAAQRNYGMEKAKGEWILFIDADEEVSQELKKEIKKVISNQLSVIGKENIYYLKRRDWWWGRELRFGEVWKVRKKGLIRLVRKNSGKWVGKVHERFEIKNQKLKIGCLKNYLNHYPHPNLTEFLEEINFYSTLRAKELLSQGKRTNIFGIIFYPLGKFILNYFIYLGFLDGASGFAYAFLMSFHSFLVRAKLYTQRH